MRILTLAVLAVGAASVIAPAQAQSYAPEYPVCLRVYGPANYNECRYTSLAQCAMSASGRSAQCIPNPFFANAAEPRPQRRYRRGY